MLEQRIFDMYAERGLLFCIGLLFIWMMIQNHKNMQVYVKEIERQGKIMMKIYDAMKPVTMIQASDMLHLSVECCRMRVFEIVHDIIRQNNVHAEGHQSIIIENLNRQVNDSYTKSVNVLHRFKYSGKELDMFLPEWWQEAVKVGYEEIYNDQGEDEDRTKKNINSVFSKVRNVVDANINKEVDEDE